MRVKFTEQWEFSENGHSFTVFEKAKEYSVSDSCGLSAIQSGVAAEVKSKSATPPVNKNKGNSPKNKTR